MGACWLSMNFDLAEKRGLHFRQADARRVLSCVKDLGQLLGLLIMQRRPYVEATRERYREFWTANVGAAAAD